MAFQSCIVACLALSFPLLATDPPSPADPSRPLTVQTTTTQTWIPGRWVRVENQDVWQPGHWETVQTTTTAPGLAAASPAPAPAATVAAPPAVATTWVSERWEQSPDGWIRYAGRWSHQSDVIVERRPIEPPTRTVVVERPVETVVVERPSTYSSVSVGFGYGSPYVGVGFGYGTPYYGWGMGVGVPLYRPYYNHCYRPIVPAYPVCPAPVRSPAVLPAAGGYVRHH